MRRNKAAEQSYSLIMLQVFFISVVFLFIAVTGLCIRILFVKGGRFPDTHIESNAAMKSLGIKCAKNDTDLCQGLPDKNTKTVSRKEKCKGNPEMEEICILCGRFFEKSGKG